jgi:release factor glutamine methyltransferase
MGSVRDALIHATTALVPVSDTPRLDAELLMAHALGVGRDTLLMGHLGAPAPASFGALLARRMTQEPLAYITGTRDFWTISLHVAPGVLIPRPDSETLVEAAVAHFGQAGPKRVLDLGTGSGALLLAALAQWPDATGLGVDISGDAVRIARENVRNLGMVDRAKVKHGDWQSGEGFDLVLCNPPYIANGEVLPRGVVDYEPHSALFAGEDGLDAYRMIAPVLRPKLNPGGLACFEIGHSQAEAVSTLFRTEGFSVTLLRDLAGRDRCLCLTN